MFNIWYLIFCILYSTRYILSPICYIVISLFYILCTTLRVIERVETELLKVNEGVDPELLKVFVVVEWPHSALLEPYRFSMFKWKKFPDTKLIAEAFGLWSFRLYESWVICKNLNMCDHHFGFLEFQKFKTSWVLFNHSRWRSADEAGSYTAERAGFNIVKCFSHLYCARGGKSCLCRTYRAHRVEKGNFG